MFKGLFLQIPIDVVKVFILPHLSPLQQERLRNVNKKYRERIASKLQQWKNYSPYQGLFKASKYGYMDIVQSIG